MFEQIKPLLLFILPAAVLCTLVGLWAWRKTPTRSSLRAGDATDLPTLDRNLPLALLVPMALIVGWSITLQPFAWKPHSTIEWVPYVILAGGIAAVIEALRAPRALAWLVRLAAAGAAMWMLGKSSMASRWNAREATMWLGAGLVGTVLVCDSLARAARERGGLPSLLFVLAGAMSAAIMLLTGEIKMPMLMGGVCACVGPGLIVALFRPMYAMGSLAIVSALCFGAMWFYSITLGETPRWCALLGVTSIVLIPLTAMGPLGTLAGWKRWLVRCTLVALPGLAGLGILLAQRAAQPAPH